MQNIHFLWLQFFKRWKQFYVTFTSRELSSLNFVANLLKQSLKDCYKYMYMCINMITIFNIFISLL